MLASEIYLIPDWTVLVQLVVFIIVLTGLSYFVFRPVRRIILLRKARIEKLMEEANLLRERAKHSVILYEGRMKEAREAANFEREKIRKLGREQEESIKSVSRKEAAAIINTVLRRIADAKAEALTELKKDSVNLADAIVKKVSQ